MNVLTLIIKQVYFDQIVAGAKKEEIREIRPKTQRKYVVLDDEEAIIDIIKYHAIRFFVGYNKNRSSAVVKVNNALIEQVVDEDDQPIFFKENGIENVMCNVVYELGEIIEVNR